MTNGTNDPTEAEIEAIDDPVMEFYQGRDAVLTVLAVEDERPTGGSDDSGDGYSLLLVDASLGSVDDLMVSEYDDLDVLLETNAERIGEIVAAAAITPDGTAAELAWEQAVVAVSPAMEPVIVVRSGPAEFSVLDPVEALDDGRPGHLGTYDSITDAIWHALEFLSDDDDATDADIDGAADSSGDVVGTDPTD